MWHRHNGYKLTSNDRSTLFHLRRWWCDDPCPNSPLPKNLSSFGKTASHVESFLQLHLQDKLPPPLNCIKDSPWVWEEGFLDMLIRYCTRIKWSSVTLSQQVLNWTYMVFVTVTEVILNLFLFKLNFPQSKIGINHPFLDNFWTYFWFVTPPATQLRMHTSIYPQVQVLFEGVPGAQN